MALDPYASCPCGSGKKFKWCCQPIHEQIVRVYQLDDQGQTAAALKLMDEVAEQNSDNAEVWGRKAQLLFQNELVDEAEKALDKAFAVNPNYAFGYFLRGRFRLFEGEIAGALKLLRKAAELYSPEAGEILSQIQVEIFDSEMKLNRPIAAHAAILLASRLDPTQQGLREGIQQVFGPENPNLPPSAKKEYRFKPLPASAPEDKRKAWEVALSSAATGKLSHAVPAFERLTEADATDAAAWYNLALSHAWIGNNAQAVDALDRYVTLEPDEAQAADAWALAEVLRVGQGMEDQADQVEHSITVPLQEPEAFVRALGELERDRLLTAAQMNKEEGVLTAIILDPPPPALTPELAGKQNARLGAFVLFMGNLVRLWNSDKEVLDRTFANLQKRGGAAMGQPIVTRGPAKFHDLATNALTFPQNVLNQEDANQRVSEGIVRYYEEAWLQRPLKALGGVPPVDAAGHGVLRKKLRGVLQFLEECMTAAHMPYDFDRLRRKLGLLEGSAPTTEAGSGAALDIRAMGPAELAGLAIEGLNYAQLEQAYQSAHALDARELAGKFATPLLGQPPPPEKPDRYPLFNQLINAALAQGDTTEALDLVNAGEKDDCEHNEGRRRNDYELRRGQLHVRRGEVDQATGVFDRLIDRAPSELKYRTTATEALLSAKQGAKALRYAEAGLVEARKQQNRDAEGHLAELADAARRQSG